MIRILKRSGLAVGLVAVGYVLGLSGALTPSFLRAQDPFDLETETEERIRAAHEALHAAMQALQQEGRYVPATVGINSFAVTSGGVDAIQDLESGHGVDPETFAALYANRAVEEVAAHLTHDNDGVLHYKNRKVRLYSISRLKQIFVERDQLAGVDVPLR